MSISSQPTALRLKEAQMTEQPQSLRDLLQAAKAHQQSIESSAQPNSDAYRGEVSAAVAKLEECQRLISQVSLFSSNEGLEDITTADLQYEPMPH
jgi:immunoglobulin-binding protein 1